MAYNHFHLVMMTNDTLNKVRSRINRTVQGTIDKAQVVEDGKNIFDEDHRKISDIKNNNLIIGKAYKMKKSLIQMYDYPDISSATEHLRMWLDWVDDERDLR